MCPLKAMHLSALHLLILILTTIRAGKTLPSHGKAKTLASLTAREEGPHLGMWSAPCTLVQRLTYACHRIETARNGGCWIL